MSLNGLFTFGVIAASISLGLSAKNQNRKGMIISVILFLICLVGLLATS